MILTPLTQRLAPLANKPAGMLLHEIYRSLQGESTFAGLPCVFVRLAVCDSRCAWCDTPHAFTQGTSWTLDAIVAEVRKHRTTLVEITGGEPLIQPEVFPLMTLLADLGQTVLLETSGAHDVAPVDGPTYATVAIGLLTVAAVAAWVPARRAARFDTTVAMKAD